MALSKDIIYSNWTSSKWLYKIEEVYCPPKFFEHLNGIKRQDEFFKLLEYNMVDFLSSFTEIMGGSRRRSRTVMMQLIITSNKIYTNFLNISKMKLNQEIRKKVRRNYLQILNTLEFLLNDCEQLNEKLLHELPVTAYALFITKGNLKREIVSLKHVFSNSSIEVEVGEIAVSGLVNLIGKSEVKRLEIKYVNHILSNFLKFDTSELEEKINELLYSHLQKKDLEKFNKKLNKIADNGIAFGIPDHSYSYFTFNHSMEKFLSRKEGIDHIKNLIKDKIIPKLGPNEKILNTNIPEKLLLDAGLKKGQYAQPKPNIVWLEI
ncbi:hypothetical protein K7A41_14905 [Sphingobacterium sp. InxBP1]|uniref:hypothetical protein n=1 Tax=Sphingobacterium sp. InxBP1 TaxID=2870328 RepID=UPI002244B6D1|nr:hypothetical protein [Sphingobacterium sp. InxBP1]MCW8312520.1 hypothetical protein [Sphingobacterium sp. InxBP1]